MAAPRELLLLSPPTDGEQRLPASLTELLLLLHRAQDLASFRCPESKLGATLRDPARSAAADVSILRLQSRDAVADLECTSSVG